MPGRTRSKLSANIMSRLDMLARISAEPEQITRLYLSKQHRAAADLVADWMREAGLSTSIDPAGTVVGRKQGTEATGKTLLIGSHIDTVRNAGRYDGCLGVVLAIAAMAELERTGLRLPYAVEVLAFGDEEGVRFPFTLTGSRAVSGQFDPVALDGRDVDGISLRDALSAFGVDPLAITTIGRNPAGLLGYLEVHIEQGPVLEAEGLPVGVVTAISGASRLTVLLTGKAGHAGTLPMPMRRDALATAAEVVLTVEQTARETGGLVATVGSLAVRPGAVNVVPGQVELTIDIRSPIDRTRRTGQQQIERAIKALARKRQVQVEIEQTYNERAATCDQRFIRHLSSAMEAVGATAFGLPSGAGHDGLAISRVTPIGMLFVRCKGGISHHPDEMVKADDVEIATRVLIEALRRLSLTGTTIS